MRGRLIPNATFDVEIAQLDTQLSEQAAPGVDRVFREPKVWVNPETNQRETGRRERTIRLPAQIAPTMYGQLQLLANGVAPKTQLKVTFHYEDLEERGMVDDRGRTLPIRINDRLVAVYELEEPRRLLIAFPHPPGVFVTEAQPSGFMGGRVNLLVCTLGDRAQGKAG